MEGTAAAAALAKAQEAGGDGAAGGERVIELWIVFV